MLSHDWSSAQCGAHIARDHNRIQLTLNALSQCQVNDVGCFKPRVPDCLLVHLQGELSIEFGIRLSRKVTKVSWSNSLTKKLVFLYQCSICDSSRSNAARICSRKKRHTHYHRILASAFPFHVMLVQDHSGTDSLHVFSGSCRSELPLSRGSKVEQHTIYHHMRALVPGLCKPPAL